MRDAMACFFLVAILCSPVAAEPRSANAPSSSSWRISLSVSTQCVVPREPLLIYVGLSYNGDAPFVGYVSSSRVSARFVPPSGISRHISLSSLPYHGVGDEVPPLRGRTYENGYTREVTMLALYDPEREAFFFEELGKGTLQSTWDIWQGTGLPDYAPVRLASPSLAVETLRLPDAEAVAFGLWGRQACAEIFLTGAGDGAAETALRALVQTRPRSAYAKYALMALARRKAHQREQISDAAGGAIPGDEQEQAARLAGEELHLLEQIVNACPTFHLMPVVLDRLVEAARAAGDADAVRKYAEMLVQLPGAPKSFRLRAQQVLDMVARRLERP